MSKFYWYIVISEEIVIDSEKLMVCGFLNLSSCFILYIYLFITRVVKQVKILCDKRDRINRIFRFEEKMQTEDGTEKEDFI